MRVLFDGTTFEIVPPKSKSTTLRTLPRSFVDLGKPTKHEFYGQSLRVYGERAERVNGRDAREGEYQSLWIGFCPANSQWPEYWPLSRYTLAPVTPM